MQGQKLLIKNVIQPLQYSLANLARTLYWQPFLRKRFIRARAERKNFKIHLNVRLMQQLVIKLQTYIFVHE